MITIENINSGMHWALKINLTPVTGFVSSGHHFGLDLITRGLLLGKCWYFEWEVNHCIGACMVSK